jgi:hypothetical protein
MTENPWTVGEGFPVTVVSVFEAGNVVMNQAGLFIYSGVPAHGNLVVSVAGSLADGIDEYGNPYFGGGVVYYSNNPGNNYFIGLNAGALNLGNQNFLNSGSVGSGFNPGPSGNNQAQMYLVAPRADASTDLAQIIVSSGNVDGDVPTHRLSTGNAFTGATGSQDSVTIPDAIGTEGSLPFVYLNPVGGAQTTFATLSASGLDIPAYDTSISGAQTTATNAASTASAAYGGLSGKVDKTSLSELSSGGWTSGMGVNGSVLSTALNNIHADIANIIAALNA